MDPKTCRFCGITFKKREHVVRHERSHTKEQPFSCPHCDKTFSRQDSVSRHIRTHGIGSSGGASTSASRKRASATPTSSARPSPAPSPFFGGDGYSGGATLLAAAESVLKQELPQMSMPSLAMSMPSSGLSSNPFTLPEIALPDENEYPGDSGMENGESSHFPDLTGFTDGHNPGDVWGLLNFHDAPSIAGTSRAVSPIEGSDLLDLLMNGELPFSTHWPLDQSLITGYDDMLANPGPLELPKVANMLAPFASTQEATVESRSTNSPEVKLEEPFSEKERGDTIRKAHRLITDVGSSLTSKANAITADFVNTCLTLFWDQFHPCFPILHRPTFNPRESIPPLLLNQIALGSLFCEAKNAKTKGEALWLIAHKGVAAAWDTLIAYQGQWDQRKGIQLVLTALLGQVYAHLSSNRVLRATSRTFHSLGFRWALETSMYSRDPSPQLDSLSSPEDTELAWRRWAASEVQLRAVLGHYVLDGFISSFDGLPPTIRHTLNLMSPVCPRSVFEADTAHTWAAATIANSAIPSVGSFCEIFTSLFDPNPYSPTLLHTSFSLLSLYTILEGLQSIVSDYRAAKGHRAVGQPAPSDIGSALSSAYSLVTYSTDVTTDERSDLLIRWHGVYIHLLSDVPALLANISSCVAASPTMNEVLSPSGQELYSWAQTPAARRCLLHAVAIQTLAGKRPVGDGSAIHLAGSIFLSAIVMFAFVTGVKTMPSHSSSLFESRGPVNWSMLSGFGTGSPPAEGSIIATPEQVFVVTGGIPLLDGRPLRNPHQVYPSVSLLKKLGHVWGVSKDYGDAVSSWLE